MRTVRDAGSGLREALVSFDVRADALSIEHTPRKFHAALVWPEAIGAILKRALAPFVAHRTIERMVDQQELEHSGPRFDHVGRARADNHPLGADGRARRLQFRHLLDLDDADAA